MNRKSVFLEIFVRRFLESTRLRIPQLAVAANTWKRSQPRRCAIQARTAAKLFLLLLSIFAASRSSAVVMEIGPIGLTVADLNRELFFYTNTLPFQLISVSEASGADQDALLGLRGVQLRVAKLKLGDECITLTVQVRNEGRPIPIDSRSYDHWFQHLAIVVRDMDEAYEQLRQHKVKHVSTAPQTLPAWNKGAAGIKAFYFRDPEDHVLEIIWFPPGKGDPKWQRSRRRKEADSVEPDVSASSRRRLLDPLFLGIDHTAIVVSDTDKSLAFYRDLLGLRVVGESENYGVEQEHLNQVFGARLRITGLRAEHGPGIEFLEYITPSGGRDLPPNAKSNDLVFWNTHLVMDDAAKLLAKLRASQAVFVSGATSLPSQIVRDPDGHAMQFDVAFSSPTLSVQR